MGGATLQGTNIHQVLILVQVHVGPSIYRILINDGYFYFMHTLPVSA